MEALDNSCEATLENNSQSTADVAAAWYLAGIIDGEGNIKTGRDRRIRIRVCDKDIITACMNACDTLGISYRVYWDKPNGLDWKDYHELNINGYYNLKKASEIVPIQNVVKRGQLEYAVNEYQTIYASKIDEEHLLKKAGLL